MELDCGIAYRRILAWLSDELRLESAEGGWKFQAGESICSITATELGSRAVGMLDLERTCLRIVGDSQATEEFMCLFTLRFMSAGG